MSRLALKYRPSSFTDLVGQLHAAKSLKNSIDHNQIGHAYLFFGSRGVGKTSTARILAKCLNCQTNGPSTNPCNTCDNCVEIAAGNNLDVLEMDAASNRGIEHIRELRESVRFAPMKSKYKIYIIDEVHMLTNESFNALLKTLEEPPAHVVFILATTEHHKIPETILSRCQSFAFRKFSAREIKDRLQHILEKEKIISEEEALNPIAQKAEGSMRDAISLLDQVIAYCGDDAITTEAAQLVLGFVPLKTNIELLEAIRVRDLKKVISVLNDIHFEGYNLKRFLWDFIEFQKNLLFVGEDLASEELLNLSEKQMSELKAVASKWDRHEIVSVFEAFYQLYNNWSIFSTSKSSEVKVSLEMAIVDLFNRLEAPSVSSVMQKISSLTQAMQEGKAFSNPQAKAAADVPVKKTEGKQDVDLLIQKEFMAKEESSSPLDGDIFN